MAKLYKNVILASYSEFFIGPSYAVTLLVQTEVIDLCETSSQTTKTPAMK